MNGDHMFRRGLFPIVAGAAALTVLGSLVSYPAAAVEDTCANFTLIGARGTDAPRNEDDFLMGPTTIDAAYQLQEIFEDAGKTVRLDGVEYPAVAAPSLDKRSIGYPNSVQQGSNELQRMISTESGRCADTEFVLLGYSQGADVVTNAMRDMPSSSADRIAGALVFGNPSFSPYNSAADIGTYSPARAGFFGPHAAYDQNVDAPTVSSCRAWDGYCQMTYPINTFWGGQIWARDFSGILEHNDGGLNAEHEKYLSSGNVETGACELAQRMGFSACGDSNIGPAIDVAFLVDLTGHRSDVVQELQARADELVASVSHGQPNARYAVVGYGEGAVENATNGFTKSDTEAVSALQGLQTMGGTYGSIYSAINEVNSLNWRPGAKKVTLTLSTSRACSQQYCTREATTRVASSFLLKPGDGERAGAYTNDNVYFFESAGWGQAMRDGIRGANKSPSEYIDPLVARFKEGVVAPDSESVSGTTDLVAGMSGSYTADGLIPHYSDSPARSLVWRVEQRGSLGTRAEEQANSGGGDGGVSVSSSRATEEPDDAVGPPASQSPDTLLDPAEADDSTEPTDPATEDASDSGEVGEEPATEPTNESSESPSAEPNPIEEVGPSDDTPVEPVDPESLPNDQGPTFTPSFDQPGIYDVIVDAYLDGAVYSYSTRVQVYAVPTAEPAAPYVSSQVHDNEQELHWVAGEGEPAVGYGFTDDAGDIVQAVSTTSGTVNADGTKTYTETIPLEDPSNPFELMAFNEVGSTPAIPVLEADTASYSHTSRDNGVATGGVLEFSGEPSAELQALLPSLPPTSADLAGSYSATLTSPTGDAVGIDMSAANATMSVDGQWTTTIDFSQLMTSDATALTPLLEDGLADELLFGGTIDVQIDGSPLRFVISPSAEVTQIDEFTIESNSTPPNGQAAADIFADPSEHTLEFANSIDPSALSFVAEAEDPLKDWSSASLTNVRTWIGTTEVVNDLAGTAVWVDGTETPTGAGARFSGTVAGHTPQLMREFLQNGTVAFTVDGGQPTVFDLRLSKDEATRLFPDTKAPEFVGRDQIDFAQYAERSPWRPAIDWGTSNEYSRYVSFEGDLPAGLRWNWSTQSLTGVATIRGSFPVTLTADGDSGRVSKTYVIKVGDSSTRPSKVLSKVQVLDSGGAGTLAFAAEGYFRTDNAAFAQTLPIITQFAPEGFLNDVASDVQIRDRNGNLVSVPGTFSFIMFSSNPDALFLYSEDALNGDAGSILASLKGGGTVSFIDSFGQLNSMSY